MRKHSHKKTKSCSYAVNWSNLVFFVQLFIQPDMRLWCVWFLILDTFAMTNPAFISISKVVKQTVALAHWILESIDCDFSQHQVLHYDHIKEQHSPSTGRFYFTSKRGIRIITLYHIFFQFQMQWKSIWTKIFFPLVKSNTFLPLSFVRKITFCLYVMNSSIRYCEF